jgi:tetratricopeptide (TPR) repeat protein
MPALVRLQQLLDASKRGLPALTIELGRLYLAERPEHEPALVIVGEAYADLARHAEARALYERALALVPAEPDRRARILALLGQLEALRGQFPAAEAYFREAIAAAPTDASAYIYLGGLLARLGRFDEAVEAHRRATDCLAGCIDEAYLNLGFVYRAQGQYLAALECFRHALALDPSDEATQAAIADMEAVLFGFPEA